MFQRSKILKPPSHLHFVKYRNESTYIEEAGGIQSYFSCLSQKNCSARNENFSIISIEELETLTAAGKLPQKNIPSVFVDSLYERISPSADKNARWCNILFAYDLFPEVFFLKFFFDNFLFWQFFLLKKKNSNPMLFSIFLMTKEELTE